ncbi:DUF3761 domain-containing protein [Streptomyces syringium]|uniref:DUF3761 domain-containing protein n=1 Tax=Streptomyces syringium TaxID=76729 RepID=A0ABS4YAZ0_9ACTN|nr:DUF3761 domain-containing protein [Streptomyces syringium]MBP2405955.1 hypothetical protein [Streptomyces syringium]
MSTFKRYGLGRAGAALLAALALGFGAVGCDDGDGGAKPDLKPTPSASVSATPSDIATPSPTPTPTAEPTPTSAPTSAAPSTEPPADGAGSVGGGSGSVGGGAGGTSGGGASTAGVSTGGSHSGASALCNDGSYSYSAHRRGTCSHHGGVAQWLKDLPS